MSTLHPADTPPRAEPVAQPAASPMGPTPSRCASLDAVRGLAVLGILAMNITSFASPSSAYMDPRVQGFAGVDRASWWIVHLLFDVKMMTIFSALFGAGIALMADRALRASGRPAVLHYRRMFWLLLVGLAHAYLLWYGDILVLYALCGMLVYPLRRLRPRTLIVLGLAIMLVTPLVNVAMGGGLTLMRGYAEGLERRQEQGQTLTPDQERDLAGWHEIEKQFTTPPQRVEEEIAAHTTSYPAYLQHNARLAFWMQTKITLMWSIWRVTGLMLIGMALLKTGFLLGQAPP
ncbi:MAG TPA: hypothetical protein VD963_04785, partial [Phycisphaerales bacterium]|nr:hypothetical protein [Phycisphaerales bacterium]